MDPRQWFPLVGAVLAVAVGAADAWRFHSPQLGPWDVFLIVGGLASLGVTLAGPPAVRALRRRP